MANVQTITACAFIYEGHRLLIAKRAAAKKFLPNKYELLGGHVEFGETLEDALKRELMEEIHVSISVEEPFYAFTYLRDDDTDHCVEIDFFARLKPKDQRIRLNASDHSEHKWITEHEVARYFDKNDNEGVAVRRGFRILKNDFDEANRRR